MAIRAKPAPRAPAPRPRRTRIEVERQRHQALALAIEVFGSEGIDALSIRRLADGLGVPPMSLYRHFSGKAELLRQVWDELLASSLRAALAAADRRSVPCQRPAAFVDGFIGYWLEHPESYLLVFATGNERLAVKHGLPPYGQQQAVQEHFKAAALLIERCSPRRVDDEVMAGLLELMFCRTFGLLHPVLYFPSYPWRDIDAMRQRLFDELSREVEKALGSPAARAALRR
jgi:AcrR family transcriptional regulator